MKTALIITSFNRPQYFVKCLESVRNAIIPPDTTIIMVDDHSTDRETIRLFNEFSIDGIPIIKFRNARNSRVCFSLKLAFDKAFELGCESAINIDSDAIVKPEFIERLNNYRSGIIGMDKIVTGFNSRNKNRDGSERHPVISQGDGFLFKGSVGGINFCINETAYNQYVKPALETSISKGGNWDHMACINSMKDDKPVVCITPSVVQHIGFDSSMGHTEPPDVACDFFSIYIPEVTLIGVDCMDINRLIKAQEYSTRDVKFGGVKLLSSLPSKNEQVEKIDPIRTKQTYSEFIIKKLHNHISTSHCLIIQYDGFVTNWKAWDDDWLQWDYIGATWWYKDNMNMGNGGFSLRSKKLMEFIANDPEIKILHPEDDAICRKYRHYLESKGFKFAPDHVANLFAIEAYNVPPPDNKYGGQFGFHGGNVDFSGTEHSHINVKANQTHRRGR